VFHTHFHLWVPLKYVDFTAPESNTVLLSYWYSIITIALARLSGVQKTSTRYPR